MGPFEPILKKLKPMANVTMLGGGSVVVQRLGTPTFEVKSDGETLVHGYDVNHAKPNFSAGPAAPTASNDRDQV